jgi:hypothetical protein
MHTEGLVVKFTFFMWGIDGGGQIYAKTESATIHEAKLLVPCLE